jgi:hypothetical protein
MNLGRESSIFLAVPFLVDLGLFDFFSLVGRFFVRGIAGYLAMGNARKAIGWSNYDGGRLAIVVSGSYAQ